LRDNQPTELEEEVKNAKKMDLQDLKLAAINMISLAVSFTNIEMGLKILLLIASIVYTVTKTVEIYKKRR
jgi:hypothetical protein